MRRLLKDSSYHGKTFILKPQNEEEGGKKVDLNTTKNLGGIGALLMFFFFIPYAGSIIALVGLILLMIGAKGLADYYKEDGIFNNALYGVITAIVGAIAFIGVVVFALVGFFTDLGVTLGWTSFTDWSSLDGC